MALLRRLSVVSAVSTFALIALGGLVRASDSGLGCSTDWPGCNGRLIPDLASAEVVIEFSHRLLAAAVGSLIAGLALLAVTRFRHDQRILWPAVGAAVLVIVQAWLGRVVVKAELEPAFVVLHLGTALVLLSVLILLAVRAHPDDRAAGEVEGDARLATRAAFASGAVLVLLLVGSYLSGVGEAHNAGFPAWPLIEGRLVPDLGDEVIALHWLHRTLALVVGAIVAVVAAEVIRTKAERPRAARLAHAALGLFVIEILIGAANVWTQSSPGVKTAFVTAHLAAGAAIWGCLAGTAIVLSRPAASARNDGVRVRLPARGGA